MSSWAAQDPLLIELWQKGEGIDYIVAQLAKVGPKRKPSDVYPRVGELRKRGVELAERTRGGRWTANSYFAGKVEAPPADVTTRIDGQGRTVTVCPPRWCAGSKPTWWG